MTGTSDTSDIYELYVSVIKAYFLSARVSISNNLYITQPEQLSQRNAAK